MLSNWQRWCRLCGKCDSNEFSIEVESLGSLNFIIQKHFSISLSGTSLICTECYQFIFKLRQFVEQCEKANSLFNKICHSNFCQQNDANYLQQMRYEAGLDEEKKFMVVEVDQLGIDNLLFAEVSDGLANDDEKPLIDFENSKETQLKNVCEAITKEEVLSDDSDDNNDDNNDGNDSDPTFDSNADNDSGDQNSDEDALSSMSEMSVAELKIMPRKKKSNKNKKKSMKRKPLGRELKCLLCDIVFDNKRRFDTHMRNEHSKDERPFLCAECPKRYKTLYALTVHETIHLPEAVRNTFPCELCDKRFRKLDYVQAHVRAVHSGERSFICEECGKSFGSKCGLNEHLMTHNDDYPIQCPHCPKRFKFKARLKIHEEIHNTTMHTCTICGQQLSTSITLKRHMDVHSEVKRFKCQYCGNEFKRAKALKNHLILHTGLRPYTCPWCDRTFVNGANCRSHKKKMHPAELAALEASGLPLPSVHMPTLRELQPK